MTQNNYEIRDNCRRNLNRYTIKAFSHIPKIDNPLILDMGCGTGVPTLALIEICNGHVYAVDTDDSCLIWLRKKVKALDYSNRIEVIHASAFDCNLFQHKFDIVIAEGLLNVIGFERGLTILIDYLKDQGYMIIHDELHNDLEKKTLFAKYKLELVSSFELNEKIWWNEYYSCIEKSIMEKDDEGWFEEMRQIDNFKENSENFKSIYYIVKK